MAFEFITNPYFGIVIAFIGILFGIISTVSYLQQRKRYRAQDYLFKLAEKHLDAEITDEEIQAKKRDLADILQSREKIKKEVPKLAKITVLKDKAEGHKNIFLENYNKWKECINEIGSIEFSSELPTEIRKEIEEDLLSNFLKTELIKKLKTQITLLTGLLAFVSFLTIGVIRELLVLLLVIIGIPIILKLFLITSSEKAKEKVLKITLLVITLIFFILGVFFIKLGLESSWYERTIPLTVGMGLVFAGIITCVLIKIKLIKRWIKYLSELKMK